MIEKYKHKHIQGMTCEIISITKRGAMVKQFDPNRKGSKKDTIQFYDGIYFDKEKGCWEKE